MDDVDTQQLQRTYVDMIAELRKQNKTMADLTGVMDKKKAEDTLSKELFKNRVTNVTRGMNELTGSFTTASRYLLNAAAGGGILGMAVGALVTKTMEVTKVYSELANSGMNFGGSLLEMSLAAANAGMPLDDFAQVTKASSKAVKQLGEKEWPKLQKTFREMAMSNGMYGLTTEQLDTFQITHLETLRKGNAVTKKSAVELNNLAAMTGALTDVTGVARDEIAQLAASALQSSNALALVRNMPEGMRAQAMEQMNTVTTILAAQAGEAGSFLSSAFANTKGMRGFSEFTNEGQALIGVGLGNVAGQLNNLSKNMSVEETVNTVNMLKDELGANMDSISMLALSGDAHAQQMMKVYQDLEELSAEEIKQKIESQKAQDGLTNFFLKIAPLWDNILGSFKSGLLQGLKPLNDALGELDEEKMKPFKDMLMGLGKTIGGAISSLLLVASDDNFARIRGWFTDFSEGVSNIDWKSHLAYMGDLMTIFGAMMAPIKIVASVISDLATTFPLLSGTILGGAGLLLAFSKVRGLFDGIFGSKDMTVNAGNVIVNGGGGELGGGGGWQDRASNRRRGRRSLRARARLGRMRMGRGLGGLARGLGKGALKSGLKKIPIIGALAGIGMGLMRAKNGDFLGAAMELASGVAGTVPGIGTALSFGIDGALMAKDSAGPSMRKGGLIGGAALGAAGVAGAAYLASGSEGATAVGGTIDDLIKEVRRLVTKTDELSSVNLAAGQNQVRELQAQNKKLDDIRKNVK